MVGPKSTQTRFVGIITLIIQSSLATLAPLNYHAPIDGDPLVPLIESSMHVGEICLCGWQGGVVVIPPTTNASIGMYSGCD